MTDMPLSDLKIGNSGTVIDILTLGQQRRRLFDLGIIKGTKMTALHTSPTGDPVAYYVRGAVIALRSEDASKIVISTE